MFTRTIALCLMMICPALTFGAPPYEESQIPVFPAARMLEETRNPPEATDLSKPIATATLDRKYQAHASADDVVAYYVEQLGIAPANRKVDSAPMKMWKSSGAQCTVIFYDREFLAKSSTAIKEALKKRQKLPWAGGWIRTGIFQWEHKDPRTNDSALTLTIQDHSLDSGDPAGSSPDTVVSLSIVVVNRKLLAKQQADVAAQRMAGAAAIMDLMNGSNPEATRVLDDVKAHPPSMAEYGVRVQRELGVPLYAGVKPQMKAMEMFATNLMGGAGGYWFLSKDPPRKLIEYYQKITGNLQYMPPGGVPIHFIDITDTQHKVTGHVAIFQGTAALQYAQGDENGDPNEVYYVSTLGIYKATKTAAPAVGR
jgi:hypothetical protein